MQPYSSSLTAQERFLPPAIGFRAANDEVKNFGSAGPSANA